MAQEILMVEDDLSLKPVFFSIFRNIDPKIKVDWVTSGEMAFKKVKEREDDPELRPYSLVIADIFLDGMLSGLEFLRLCRDASPNMPVIVMSSLPLNKFLSMIGTQTVCPTFIEKPLRIPECRGLLKRILKDEASEPKVANL